MIQWRTFTMIPRKGTSHCKSNLPCQDKTVVQENEKFIAAVLSDGLGSLEYSQVASETVTRVVSKFLFAYDYQNFDAEKMKEDILIECKKALDKSAKQYEIHVSEMDCTLLFVIVAKKANWFILGQLGDGAICLVKKNQAVLLSENDDQFKASSNMTKTILSSNARNYFYLKNFKLTNFLGFLLTSDGLENELYTKVGIKKQIFQKYYNIIIRDDEKQSANKITRRWNDITSDESYGFTDDMSLAVIYQSKKEIELPKDANWLCICGHRNRLESSRCEKCCKDITRIYKGVDYKQYGGKEKFFLSLNCDAEKERNVLNELCAYKTDNYDKQSSQHADFKNQKQQSPLYGDKNVTQPARMLQPTGEYEQVKYVDTFGRNIKGIFINVVICSLFFVLGILVRGSIIFSSTSGNDTLSSEELADEQAKSGSLASENEELLKEQEELNKRIQKLENSKDADIHLPDDYGYYALSNGDVYVGRMRDNLADGIGVIYSSGLLTVGNFSDGKKNGEFFVLYENGKSENRKYEDDIWESISKTEKDKPAISDPSTDDNSFNQNTNGVQTSVTYATQEDKNSQQEEERKTYLVIYFASVRTEANKHSDLVTTLPENTKVYSFGVIETDDEGNQWIKIMDEKYEGWIRLAQVEEIDKDTTG